MASRATVRLLAVFGYARLQLANCRRASALELVGAKTCQRNLIEEASEAARNKPPRRARHPRQQALANAQPARSSRAVEWARGSLLRLTIAAPRAAETIGENCPGPRCTISWFTVPEAKS
jgi:hypothetical protein